MMRRITTSDPNVMRIRPRSGCNRAMGAVTGVPFLAFGLFVALLPASKPGEFTGGHAAAVVLAGVLLLGIGVFFTFNRRGVVIDMNRRELIRWWGILVPMRRWRFPIDHYTSIKLGPARKAGQRIDDDSFYPILMKGTNQPDVRIVDVKGRKQSRQAAREIAEFTGLSR